MASSSGEMAKKTQGIRIDSSLISTGEPKSHKNTLVSEPSRR